MAKGCSGTHVPTNAANGPKMVLDFATKCTMKMLSIFGKWKMENGNGSNTANATNQATKPTSQTDGKMSEGEGEGEGEGGDEGEACIRVRLNV
ncbi:hypothetical protein AWZ03_009023 [Drosophila navojoa]|uniref:Uncharacterized protein n=1 Tax=Drosophila navojoa TaxID=7232 RepID=A0A484B9Q3_DRONA|nr:hypothetical protein AWZ03_009023 [Drosophila navojoa]